MQSRILILGAVILFAATFARTEENTETRLSKYGQDLAEAWKTYPTEKDAVARKQKVQDLATEAAADLAKLDAPDKITIKVALDNYVDNLLKAKTLFRLDKMTSERSFYIAGCSLAFKNELKAASDLEVERPAHKCFDLLVDWADDAKNRGRMLTDDSRTALLGALRDAFTGMIKFATKDEGDPTELYNKQLKEVKRRMPTTNPAVQKVNQPFATLLEDAAKKVNDINRK